jgi:hypothetical protein
MTRIICAMSLLSFLGIANAADYSEGQVWAYRTRAGEDNSTVLINKIEADEKLGRIFHISVDGVRVRNSRAPGGVSTDLPHFPVSEETLKKSVTKLRGKKAPNPKYADGYKAWKAEFDAGRAGIFTTSVAEIVSFVEEAINKQ